MGQALSNLVTSCGVEHPEEVLRAELRFVGGRKRN